MNDKLSRYLHGSQFFIVRWVFLTCLGSFLSYLFIFILIHVVDVNKHLDDLANPWWTSSFIGFPMGIIYGAVLYLELRNILKLSISWILVTGISWWIFFFGMIAILNLPVTETIWMICLYVLTTFIGGCLIGFLQCIVIGGDKKKAMKFIFVTGGSVALFVIAFLYYLVWYKTNQYSLPVDMFSLTLLVVPILSFTFLGWTTGSAVEEYIHLP
jgi:hypothetical protein